ncbi:unnamed protein product [Echinostoma caproni]|uniref:Rho-GAP domain-containing protein n=1 Tax=Echinostoma caproni TaxID=27848 RepID=A0A183AHW6_9TREM|nr:unnamed protein product [Echinostoma caproni]
MRPTIQGTRLPLSGALADGCLSHLTSVATAALMTFLRRFLIPNAENTRAEADLYQVIVEKESLDQNS